MICCPISRNKRIMSTSPKEFSIKHCPQRIFFQLLHDACWVGGEWSKNLGHSLLAPDAYIGLPRGTEIFDSSEAYFVVVDFEKAFLFANDEAKNEVVTLKIDVIDYVKIWEQARAEIVFGKNGVA